MKKNNAFTLAEVLITLGIIGIVAAMTLPGLVAKYKEKVMITQAKRTMSIVYNALNLTRAKTESADYSNFFISTAKSDETADIIFKNLNIIERCKSNKNGCGGDIKIKPQYRTNDGYGNVSSGGSLKNYSRAVLKDGSILGIYQAQYAREGCQHDYIAYKKDSNGNYLKDENGDLIAEARTETCCGKIFFDTNGVKGPNQYGQDVFIIYIQPNSYIQSLGSIQNVIKNNKLYYENYISGGEF